MNKEELEKEARINLKRRFGEFFPQLIISYVMGAEPREKRIAELEKRCANYEMTISKMEKGTCDICKEIEKDKKIEELEAKIEKMKADVMANIKWADKNCDNMWQKLVKMWNQWEIKEND